MLLAGCTTPSPPPATATGVQLVTVPASATVGDAIEVTFRVTGGTEGVTHSEVHFGPVSPDPGVASSSAPGSPEGSDTYRSRFTVPAGAPTLFLRAHVLAGGKDLWSDERTITVAPAAPTTPRFTRVFIPADVEAGVPFTVTYRLEGTGTSGHVGSHFSQQSSAGFPENFPAADWPGMRASQHLGGDGVVTLPLDVDVVAIVPTPGTWYIRPHALVDNVNHWGPEVTITAADPVVPNIVLLQAPNTAVAGTPAMVRFQLNTQPGSSGHIGAHYSMNTSADLPPGFPATNWTGMRMAPHHGGRGPVPIPGEFSTNITFPLPGTWYYRAHALVDGQNVWAEQVTVQVAAPAEPTVVVTMAPTTHELLGGPGLQLQPVEVEWTVLTPEGRVINHTHLHHGRESIAQPGERAIPPYPQSTALQNGSAPMVFRGNFTPAQAEGPYYFRAMATFDDGEGLPLEVWSEEWVVQVTLSRP